MTGPKNTVMKAGIDLPALVARGAQLLRQVGGPFALIGGAALQVYGNERYTKDVDFAVREAQGAQALALWPGESRPLGIGGVALIADGACIDLIDRRRELRALYEEAIDATQASRVTVDAAGELVPLVPAEYLAVMKFAADRDQDVIDVLYLLKLDVFNYRMARDIVERHLGRFGARHFDRLAQRAGRGDARSDYEEGEK